MIPDKDNSSIDSLSSEEDEKEKQFMNMHFSAKKQYKEKYVQHIPKPIEMMFIIFSVYKDKLLLLASDFNCKIKIAMDRIQILSDNSQEDLHECVKVIKLAVDKINYIELTLEARYEFYQSPYFFQKSRALKFYMTKFSGNIYIHSDELSTSKLKAKSSELLLGKKIFPVCFKSYKHRNQEIHTHLRSFVRIIIRHYQLSEFKGRNVIVEVDRQENKVFCIGEKERDLLACKNIIKNTIYATVGLVIRYDEVPEDFLMKMKTLKAYTTKISNFPIYIGKLTKCSLVMFSKDNILKALMKKQKFINYLNLKSNSEIGLYFIRMHQNYPAKKLTIENLCQEKGYDFTNLGGGPIHFFKKIFLEEHEDNTIEEALQILILSLQKLQDVRDKFDIPSIVDYSQKKPKQEIEIMQGEFYLTGEVTEHEVLSDLLRRNVMKEHLRMSKPALIAYKIFQGKEQGPVFWSIGQNNAKIECRAEEMKAGIDYFQGKVKHEQENNKSERVYYIQSKIVIL